MLFIIADDFSTVEMQLYAKEKQEQIVAPWVTEDILDEDRDGVPDGLGGRL